MTLASSKLQSTVDLYNTAGPYFLIGRDIQISYNTWDQPELYLKIQFVPRSKHSPSRLQKPVS